MCSSIVGIGMAGVSSGSSVRLSMADLQLMCKMFINNRKS